jgi:hypothetical protein
MIISALGNANINVGGREITVGQQSVNIRGIGAAGEETCALWLGEHSHPLGNRKYDRGMPCGRPFSIVLLPDVSCSGAEVKQVERSPVFFDSQRGGARALHSQTGSLRPPHPRFGLGLRVGNRSRDRFNTPLVPPCRYLRFLNLRDCYYAGSGFLDHVDNDRFDRRPWRFLALFFSLHSFLRCRTLGLGPGHRRLRRFYSRRLGHLACLTAHSRASSARFSSLFRLHFCSRLPLSHD